MSVSVYYAAVDIAQVHDRDDRVAETPAGQGGIAGWEMAKGDAWCAFSSSVPG